MGEPRRHARLSGGIAARLAGVELPDPAFDITPFELYRALAEGRAPRLLDLREAAERTVDRLVDSIPTRPDVEAIGRAVASSPGLQHVLVDESGGLAHDLARALAPGPRALYGGMALWRLAIVSEVVGETYLTAGEP